MPRLPGVIGRRALVGGDPGRLGKSAAVAVGRSTRRAGSAIGPRRSCPDRPAQVARRRPGRARRAQREPDRAAVSGDRSSTAVDRPERRAGVREGDVGRAAAAVEAVVAEGRPGRRRGRRAGACRGPAAGSRGPRRCRRRPRPARARRATVIGRSAWLTIRSRSSSPSVADQPVAGDPERPPDELVEPDGPWRRGCGRRSGSSAGWRRGSSRPIEPWSRTGRSPPTPEHGARQQAACRRGTGPRPRESGWMSPNGSVSR